MARKLLRQSATIATALALAAASFFGLGLWRRSGDVKWCRHEAAAGVSAVRPPSPDLLEQVRSACTVQRQRQRQMFGSVWRTGGREAAQCGFELARLQLISYQDPVWYRAVLAQSGVDDSEFDISTREGQDRFVHACRTNGQYQGS